MAIATGNTSFVLKPSEQSRWSPCALVELALEAGIPKAWWNVVHGGKDTIDAIYWSPRIKTISFVGSLSGTRL